MDEQENALPLGENVLVKQLKEENYKLMQRLDDYKKKELLWKNATHSFRHSHMTHFINDIRNATYYLKKQYNVEQNIQKVEKRWLKCQCMLNNLERMKYASVIFGSCCKLLSKI